MTVSFFGDGASNTGAFYEGVNLAAVWHLPVVFVCENNQYAQSTPRATHQKVKDIADRAAAFNIPGVVMDGMDVFDVYQKSGEAIDRARVGGGPTLLEAKTYRFLGHFVGDPQPYRTKEEVEQWKQRDPILLFRQRVFGEGKISCGGAGRHRRRHQERDGGGGGVRPHQPGAGGRNRAAGHLHGMTNDQCQMTNGLTAMTNDQFEMTNDQG